jgi:hypothetical protein
MSTEEEPVELKAIEAALAALLPKRGGLDRERLMYLAGRASLPAARAPGRFRWAWPAATAAMTGVAAVLLAVVSLRLAEPAPRIVERIVEVPVARSPAAAAADDAARVSNDQQFSPEQESANDTVRPAAAGYPWSLVSRVVGWPGVDSRAPASLDNYSALRNRVLRDGASAWAEPPSRHAPADGAAEPASYRQMLDSFLDDAGASQPAPSAPKGKTLFPFLGVHS